MARRKMYSEEQIVKGLAEIDAGATIASVARSRGINVQTIYQWRQRYAGMAKAIWPSCGLFKTRTAD